MEYGLIKKQVVQIMIKKKIIFTLFLLSIVITAGCLSNESPSPSSSGGDAGSASGGDISDISTVNTGTGADFKNDPNWRGGYEGSDAARVYPRGDNIPQYTTMSPEELSEGLAIKIPANTMVTRTGSGSSTHFPIDAYPRNIYLKDVNVLITEIRITRTQISFTMIDTLTGNVVGGYGVGITFQKNGETIGSQVPKYPYKENRETETLGADEVFFSF